MKMPHFLAILIFISFATALKGAEAFSISPMHLRLNTAGGVQVIRLTNTHDRSKSVRLQAFAWTQSDDPAKLEPTQDLLLVPPLFEVEPGEEQIIRIGLRRTFEAEEERTYRIMISEIPSEVDRKEGLNFNLEINMPIFVAPKGASAEPRWSLSEDDTLGSSIVLSNKGNAHVKILSIDMQTTDGIAELVKIGDQGYVFGGEQRRWPIETALAEIKGPVEIKAKTTAGPIEAQVVLPDS